MSAVPGNELNLRMTALRAALCARLPEWRNALIAGRINQYYLTGTMQDGLLHIPRDGDAVFYVRRSFERARDESAFPDIRPMRSLREITGAPLDGVALETDVLTLDMLALMRRHLGFDDYLPLHGVISRVRAVKTAFELELMTRGGGLHAGILRDVVPGLMHEGVSELELMLAVYGEMVRAGHHGLCRFAMFETEPFHGIVSFGESSIYPTRFNGPGGTYGMHPSSPMMGRRDVYLTKGQLAHLDVGFGMEGYHTDKTVCYVYDGELSPAARAIHDACAELAARIAEGLRPGAIPSEIYKNAMDTLPPLLREHFMGYGERTVSFLGHGTGLCVDEYPVIARGFDEPLECGMTIALEPKCGVTGVGMVGVEDTYVVTETGGRCITDTGPGPVYVG